MIFLDKEVFTLLFVLFPFLEGKYGRNTSNEASSRRPDR